MALVPSGKKSLITHRDILLPLFVLYGVSYVLVSQHVLAATDQTLFFIKLLLGLLILGSSSLYILTNKSAFSVTILPKRINWALTGYAALLGLFLFYALLSIKVSFPGAFPSFLSYYGFFNPYSLLFYLLLPVMAVYVLSEELFFRGVIYQYVRRTCGVFVGSLLTSIAFALAHLSFYPTYVVYLMMVSLIAVYLLEQTNTYFYGFIMHAVLDILGLLLVTSQVSYMLYTDILLRTLILALLLVVGTWVLFISPRFRRYGILKV